MVFQRASTSGTSTANSTSTTAPKPSSKACLRRAAKLWPYRSGASTRLARRNRILIAGQLFLPCFHRMNAGISNSTYWSGKREALKFGRFGGSSRFDPLSRGTAAR